MSISKKQTIKCPSCGEECELTIWQSITAEDGDLKDDLLRGKINIFKCGACGAAALVPEPLLYRDCGARLLITFTPCADDAKKAHLLEKIRRTSQESGELDDLDGWNLRFVTDYNGLLEKLLIFDCGLHDKVIEVIKLLILMQEESKMSERVCMFGKLDGEILEFMVQDRTENRVYTSRVPQSTYDAVSKSLSESGVKYKSFSWELVDRAYAANLLRGENNIL